MIKLFARRAFVLTLMIAVSFAAYVPTARATTCANDGTITFTVNGTECVGYVTSTGLGTFTTPSDWSNTNTIEVIGAGGNGAAGTNNTNAGAGGGGGGYAAVTNISSLSPSTNYSYTVDAANSATALSTSNGTWLCSSTSGCSNTTDTNVIVGAKSGAAGNDATSGAGGTADTGTGSTGGAGGGGGSGNNNDSAGGGGGSAGPSGVGRGGGNGVGTTNYGGGGGGGSNGGSSTIGGAGALNGAGDGGNSTSGTGGGAGGTAKNSHNAQDGTVGGGGGGGSNASSATVADGGAGSAQSLWDTGVGPSGGGGGGGGCGGTGCSGSHMGGAGGTYGGGAGGCGLSGTHGSANCPSIPTGGQGLLVITYTPVAPSGAPSITTSAASSITGTTATLNGSVTATGGADATQHGFAYSTNSSLSSGVSTSTLGSYTGTGSFSDSLSSLTSDTTYYYRAYATNTNGTGYGSIVSFVTPDITPPTPNPATFSTAPIATTSTTVGGMQRVYLTTTGAGTWTVPSDWNSASNTIEVIGGGGGGGGSASPGGGGGAYSKISNLTFTPSSTVNYSVGAGGTGGAATLYANGTAGGDTWFNATTFGSASVAAKGGTSNTGFSTLGAGGDSATGIGTVKYSGGDGGASGFVSGYGAGAGGAGAGAGGPYGNGGAGGDALTTYQAPGGGGGGGGGAGGDATSHDGAGGSNYSGGGGGAVGGSGAGGSGSDGGGGGGGTPGGSGGAGTEWDATHGSGGGGGGSPYGTTPPSGAGGLYGAGGAGGTSFTVSSDYSAGGAGAQGIIVITYTAIGSTVPALEMTATTASDAGGSTPIEYHFALDNSSCGSDAGTGGTSSSWQTSTSYTDSGLDPNQCYGYTIQSRDSLGNTGTASSINTAYTFANVPGAPTLGSATGSTFDITNDANGNPTSNPSTLFAAEVTSSDGTWNGKYIDASGNPSATAVWLSQTQLTSLTVTGLSGTTSYDVDVKAKNGDGVETSFGSTSSITTTAPPDTTPPTPNPATFATAPAGASTASVSMQATTATDSGGSTPIEYHFALDNSSCGSDAGTGGTSSSWQTSTSYTDSGLDPNQCYGYTIQSRDSLGNTGTASAAYTAYTYANTPSAPTLTSATPTTFTFSNNPNGNPTSNPSTLFTAQVSSSDATWNNKYIDAAGNPSATAVWLSNTALTSLVVTGLSASTSYTVTVKAENQDSVASSFSTGSTIMTAAAGTGFTTRIIRLFGVRLRGVHLL